MSGDLTYRDRALRAEARVLELEDELKAWREDAWQTKLEGDAARDEHTVAREIAPYLDRSKGAPAVARLLIALLRAEGAMVRTDRLLDLISQSDETLNGVVKVQVCYLRKALQRLGHGDALQTVWGRGYLIEAAQIASIARRVGLTHD